MEHAEKRKGFGFKNGSGLGEGIRAYYEREIAAIQALDFHEIERAVEAVRDAYEREAVIYVFGNGGSAATASHIAGDFNKGISAELNKKFHVLCLNDNIPTVMAIANDISYEEIFSFQMKGRLKASDLVIAISGSGNSGNVVKAVEYAKEIGAAVVGVTGYSGGRLREMADYHMHAAVDDMQIAEDVHMSFDHMMYWVLRRALNSEALS